MDKEQLIQGYIANKLSQTDREVVEKRLQTDPEFKEAFESHHDVAMAYKIAEAQSLKETFQNLEQKKSKNTRFSISKIGYSAIASVLIIGFFYIFNNDPTGSDLFNSNFTSYPNTYQPVTRNISENENSEAFIAYENKDFKKAEIEFKEVLITSENPNIQFYYAMTLLNMSKYDQALAQLNGITTDNYEYQGEALWYTALIHLQKEDFESAMASLQTLKRLNTPFKSNERKQLLQELKDESF